MKRWKMLGLVFLAMVVAGPSAAQQMHEQLKSGGAPGATHYGHPRLWSDGKGTIYLLRSTERENLPRDLLFSRSVNGGESWEIQDLVLDRAKPSNARSRDPQLAMDGSGRLHVVWQMKLRDGKKEIRFATSADGGKSWPAQGVKVNQADGAFEPRIALDGNGHIYVTWYDERVSVTRGASPERDLAVFFTRSPDGGNSWPAQDVKLSAAPPRTGRSASISAKPRIAADGAGRVFVAWYDTRNKRGDLYYKRSDDRGQTWLTPEVRLQREEGNISDFQLLKDPSGALFLLWSEDRTQTLDRNQVRLSRSQDWGKEWDVQALRIDDSPKKAQFPHLAADGKGNLYVAWHDTRNGEPDIYFRRSTDRGQTWLPAVRLDRDGAGVAESLFPQVATDSEGRVVVVWQDDREGLFRIYLNASQDSGRTWLAKDVRLDVKGEDPETDHRMPQIVLDGRGGAVVAWEIVKPREERKKTAVQRVPLAALFTDQPAAKKP